MGETKDILVLAMSQDARADGLWQRNPLIASELPKLIKKTLLYLSDSGNIDPRPKYTPRRAREDTSTHSGDQTRHALCPPVDRPVSNSERHNSEHKAAARGKKA